MPVPGAPYAAREHAATVLPVLPPTRVLMNEVGSREVPFDSLDWVCASTYGTPLAVM